MPPDASDPGGRQRDFFRPYRGTREHRIDADRLGSNRRPLPRVLITSLVTKVDRAVLLAAGRGTRMREMTTKLPKPMLQVRGTPVLQHIVEGLRDAGVRHLLIVVGYHAETVRDFFGDGSHCDVDIQYATQVVQDGTGRVVDLARNFAGRSPFVLSYGDILVDPANYKRLVDFPRDVEAIISVTRGEDTTKGCAVFVNDQMDLVDLREKSPLEGGAPAALAVTQELAPPYYNAGLYVFRRTIFDFTAKLKPSRRGEYELTDAIRDLAHSGKKVKALELIGEWADVRDPEVLARLNQPA